MKNGLVTSAVLCAVGLSATASAALIFSTNFDSYASSNLAGQTGFIGTGGTWATSGSMNTGQTAMLVTANPLGSGKSVRGTTEKFLSAGRTKGWLDFANSGKWAAASAGGNTTLRSEIDVYVQSGQSMASSFGIMVQRSSFEYSAGLLINNLGQVYTAKDGFALANRTNTGSTVTLNAWHSLRTDWNSVTGLTQAYVDNALVATFTSTLNGSLYTSEMFVTTDAASGGSTTLNAFGYFDNMSISTVPTPGSIALVGLAGLCGRRRRA